MFDRAIFKFGARELIQDFIGAIIATLIIGFIVSMGVGSYMSYTVNGQTIQANSPFPFLLATLPVFTFIALLAYAFYANSTLLSMSLGMSKTRKQFLGTHMLVQYGLGGLLLALSGLISVLDASRSINLSEYAQNISISNAFELIGAILIILALFNVLMFLAYRFGYRLLILLGIILTFNVVIELPFIKPIVSAISRMPAVVMLNQFRNTQLYDLFIFALLIGASMILTLRMPVNQKINQ